MQEFLINNTVNCNLMSLTGYRTLVILSLLMEAPRTIDEINNHFLNNQYIKDSFSNDTLRIYINSLRAIGCEITDANKGSKRYELISHPFDYDIPKSQLKAISRLYKSLYDKIEIRKVLEIENFITKLAEYTENINTKIFLEGISVLRNINVDILSDLLLHCKNKNQIVISYNSPKPYVREIEIVCDKLSFKFGKLYLWGNNLTHKEYSFLPVNRITKILNIKMLKSKEDVKPIKVVYEFYNHPNYIPDSEETILEKDDKKMVIEINSKNKFSVMQKILYLADNCKIMKPASFKNELINKLKAMEQCYEKV